MAKFSLCTAPLDVKRREFERMTLKGTDGEVGILISALSEYMSCNRLSELEKAQARELYLRLIWCADVVIDFHGESVRSALARRVVAPLKGARSRGR